MNGKIVEKKSDKCACICARSEREVERVQKLAGAVEHSSKKRMKE